MRSLGRLVLISGIAFLPLEAGCDSSSSGPQEPPRVLPDVRLLEISAGNAEEIQTSPHAEAASTAVVLIFTRTDCPISNRYAPEVRRIIETIEPGKIRFWLVYPDSSLTPDQIRVHLQEYGYPCSALWDPEHQLVAATGVRITPEVAVFDGSRRLVYRGRIDDRYVDFGKSRPQPSRQDLQDVLHALLSGTRLTFRSETATGCLISDLRTGAAAAK